MRSSDWSSDVCSSDLGFDSRAQQTEQVVAADMASGSVTQTGNPLDVAMNDDALLAVQAPDGDEAYTRRGDLTINESGLLTTGGGEPVLGQGGPITLPQADSISIAKERRAEHRGGKQGVGKE